VKKKIPTPVGLLDRKIEAAYRELRALESKGLERGRKHRQVYARLRKMQREEVRRMNAFFWRNRPKLGSLDRLLKNAEALLKKSERSR
jgi:hypothetical protein